VSVHSSRLRFCRTRLSSMVKRLTSGDGARLLARGIIDEFADVVLLTQK